jgi:hypothetical protein
MREWVHFSTPLGPVWVHARYRRSMYIPSGDAACVHECEGPTHDERRRASFSTRWQRAFVRVVHVSTQLRQRTHALGLPLSAAMCGWAAKST